MSPRPTHLLKLLRAAALSLSVASTVVLLAIAYVSVTIEASWIGGVVLLPGRIGWSSPTDWGRGDGSSPPDNMIPFIQVFTANGSMVNLWTTSGYVHGFTTDGEWGEDDLHVLPLWIPLAVGLGTYLAARLAERAVSRRGGCRHFGYPRTGLTSKVPCPECGISSSCSADESRP